MPSLLLTRFLDHARTGRVALAADAGASTSYDDLWNAALRVAGAIRHDLAHGCAGDAESLRGARVAVLVRPGAEFIAAIFGVWLAGGAAIVLSPVHPPAESAFVCDDGDVRVVIASRAWVDKLGDATRGRALVLIEDATSAGAPGPRAPAEVEDHDDALQLYTSGTTGRPKGAVLSHANLATQQKLVGDAWRFSDRDVLLHALPLHHMHGLAIALLTALGAGATLRMLDAFDAVAIWNEMHAATVFMAVPTMYARLCDAFDTATPEARERWSRSARALRLATSGSAALPVPLATRWEALAGVIPVERFGMTEIGVGLTNPIDGPRKKGHVGFPLPTVEARIVGEAAGGAETGELWVRGPSVFRGYHAREEATREAFVAADDGGLPWFKTGDTVTRDADGAYRILGRTSVDILKSGGYKLSALEIEGAILEMDAVSEVAVVGVPDDDWGDRVVACVVPRAGRADEVTRDAIRACVRTKLAPYKCPKDVHVMDALPRNALGKVVKPELVRLVRAITASRAPA